MKKKMPFGVYNALLCLGAALIAALAVLLAQAAESRWYLKLDVSDDRLSSLSDYTTDRLAALTEPVTLYPVYSAGWADSLRDLQMETLGRMAAACANVRVEPLDPVAQAPRLAALAGEAEGVADGTVFVSNAAGTRTVRLDPDGFVFSRRIEEEIYTIYVGEARLIGAIERACMADPVSAWFVSGHGELGEADCPSLALQLRAMGMEVREGALGLMEPAAGDVLLLLSPRQDLTAGEADRLTAFLDGGGRLVVACGADEPFDRLTELSAVLDLYGLGYRAGWAVEDAQETAFYLDRTDALCPALAADNGVMDALPGRLIVPRAAALAPPQTRPGVSASVLLTTSPRAVLKADPDSDAASFGPGDVSGTLILAAAAEQGEMHILQLASGDMLRDLPSSGVSALDAGENLAFLAACLDDMTGRDGAATLAAGVKRLPAQLIAFDSEQTRRRVSAVILLAMPCAILLAMAVVLVRRRRL